MAGLVTTLVNVTGGGGMGRTGSGTPNANGERVTIAIKIPKEKSACIRMQGLEALKQNTSVHDHAVYFFSFTVRLAGNTLNPVLTDIYTSVLFLNIYSSIYKLFHRIGSLDFLLLIIQFLQDYFI